MNEAISRRKLLFLAGLAASIVGPATVLIVSNVEAQPAEQTPARLPAPKKKKKEKEKKKKGTSSSGAASETKQPKAQ